MKTTTRIKRIILSTCFFVAIALMGNVSKLYAATVGQQKSSFKVSNDTLAVHFDKIKIGAQKNAFEKQEAALERRELLDNMSKLPSQTSEIFSNQKEEYLWFEKAKQEGDAYEKAIKELNELLKGGKLITL